MSNYSFGPAPGGGSGGGGPVTVADGADVTLGAKADAEATGNGSAIAILKRLRTLLSGTLVTSRTWTLSSGTDTVNVGNFPASQAVTLATAPTTPVTAAALPLPAGAAADGTDINSPTAMPTGGVGIRGWLSAIWTKLNGSLAVTGTFWQATQPVSLATNTPDVTDRAARLLGHVTVDSAPTTAVTGTFFQATQPVSLATNTPTLAAGTNTVGNLNEIRAATTYATVVSSAVSAGATLTLAAAGAGLFHYITSIEITNYTGIARTGAATPITVTTTNINGSPAFTFATAAAIGTTDTQRPILATPLKTTTANTATTIVCPVVTGSFWRVNVTYFVAA